MFVCGPRACRGAPIGAPPPRLPPLTRTTPPCGSGSRAPPPPPASSAPPARRRSPPRHPRARSPPETAPAVYIVYDLVSAASEATKPSTSSTCSITSTDSTCGYHLQRQHLPGHAVELRRLLPAQRMLRAIVWMLRAIGCATSAKVRTAHPLRSSKRMTATVTADVTWDRRCAVPWVLSWRRMLHGTDDVRYHGYYRGGGCYRGRKMCRAMGTTTAVDDTRDRRCAVPCVLSWRRMLQGTEDVPYHGYYHGGGCYRGPKMCRTMGIIMAADVTRDRRCAVPWVLSWRRMLQGTEDVPYHGYYHGDGDVHVAPTTSNSADVAASTADVRGYGVDVKGKSVDVRGKSVDVLPRRTGPPPPQESPPPPCGTSPASPPPDPCENHTSCGCE
eukprot:1194581-Prorocentrum_minimum.AAC.2